MCDVLNFMEENKRSLQITKLPAKCRYHRSQDKKYRHNDYLKNFNCLELFHSVYPRALALMYGGVLQSDDLLLRCPNIDNGVTARILAKPVNGLMGLGNRIKSFLRFLRPMDIVDSIVSVEIKSVMGNCRAGYTVGDELTIDHLGTMCPQALYSALPTLLLSNDNESCQCPSNVNMVTFQSDKHK